MSLLQMLPSIGLENLSKGLMLTPREKQQERNVWKTEVAGTIYIANKGFNLGTDGQPIHVKIMPSLEVAEYSKTVNQVLCRVLKTVNLSLIHRLHLSRGI